MYLKNNKFVFFMKKKKNLVGIYQDRIRVDIEMVIDLT
jgi:hypothetical protein